MDRLDPVGEIVLAGTIQQRVAVEEHLIRMTFQALFEHLQGKVHMHMFQTDNPAKTLVESVSTAAAGGHKAIKV